MKLTRAVLCADCLCVGLPDKHGRCATCGSNGIALLAKRQDTRVLFETPANVYLVPESESVYTL